MAVDPEKLRDFARRYTAAWCSQNPDFVAVFFALTIAILPSDAVPSPRSHAAS